MYLHEYQAKQLFQSVGIPVPPFEVVENGREAEQAVKTLKLRQGIVKIQVHAGGRGKSGGIKIGHSPTELIKYSEQLIGMKFLNEQTGSIPLLVSKILISPLVEIEKEYYLAATLDRSCGKRILLASSQGGINIETTAGTDSKALLKIPIQPNGTIRPYHLLYLTKFMKWPVNEKMGISIAEGIAKLLVEKDGTLIEINPLVKATDGKMWALDGKMEIDENALYRHSDLTALYDYSQLSKPEAKAKGYGLSYVELDGNIGCLVNGAGLAMATIDFLHLKGGKAANFLDIGGSATSEKIAEGFKILIENEKVEVILVNVFGGIMDCKIVTEGIITALTKAMNRRVPTIVRMEGTNVEAAKKTLQKSNLNLIVVDSFEEAIVTAVREGNPDGDLNR